MKTLLSRVAELLSDVRDFARREPVITRWLVGLAVTVAAKYGLDLDAEVIVAYLAVGTPVTIAQRRKVTPEADLLDHG